MISHLKFIAEKENIAVANDAIALIAQIANGGLRDAESLLDQLSLLPEEISVAKVWDLVGAVPEQDLLKLLQAINQQNSIAILQQCRSLLDRGREPIVVLQNLASFYLNLLIAKTAPQHSEMVAVTETCWQQLCETAKSWNLNSILYGQQHLKEAETQLKHTTQPRLWLEVTLLGLLPQVMATVENAVQPTSSIIAPTKAPLAPTKSPVNILDNSEQSNSAHPSAFDTQDPATSIPTKTPAPQARAESTDQVPVKTATPSASPPTITSEQAAESAQSVTETPTNTVVINNTEENQKIWSQVVSCLQPPTTQALLKQQCYLVNFDGLSAVVGISSAKLQKLHQGKVSNIEAAFAQVCKCKVRVQLEVVAPKNKSDSNGSSNNSSDNNAVQSAAVPEIANKPPSPEQPQATQPFTDSSASTAIPPKPVKSPNNLNQVRQPGKAVSNQATDQETIFKSTPDNNSQTSSRPASPASIPREDWRSVR